MAIMKPIDDRQILTHMLIIIFLETARNISTTLNDTLYNIHYTPPIQLQKKNDVIRITIQSKDLILQGKHRVKSTHERVCNFIPEFDGSVNNCYKQMKNAPFGRVFHLFVALFYTRPF